MASIMRFLSLPIFSAIALAGLLGTGNVSAQDKATLDLLVKKGLITRPEADSLLATPQAPALTVTAKTPSTTTIKIGGYVQGGYDWVRYKPSTGVKHANYNGFQLNRVILSIAAYLGENWCVFVTPEFDNLRQGDRNYLSDAGVKWDSHAYGAATVGLRKVDFALEEYSPTTLSKTIMNSPITNYFISGLGFGSRHVGVYWDGNLGENFTYGAALTNSDQDQVRANDGNNKPSFWTSLAYTAKDGDLSLRAGLNLGWQRDDTGRDTATQAFGITETFGYNPYVKISSGKLSLTGEMLGAYLASDTHRRALPYGFNALAAYQFNDWFEPVLRASWASTNNSQTLSPNQTRNSPADGEGFNSAWAIYSGANFYATEAIKFSAGYEFTRYREGDAGTGHADNHAIRTQIQAIF